MAAAQLMLPANRAFNSNGLAVPGAVARLYTTGTSTPAAFYSNSALTVSLGSSITANGAGRFPAAYQDTATPFRLRIEDADGAELDDIDPFYFGQTFVTVNSNAVTPQMFGAVADYDGATGTDNLAAFQAAFAYLATVSVEAYDNETLYRGAPELHIPAGRYYLSGSLVPLFSGKIMGAGGKGWGAATQLYFAAGVDGIQLQAHNTSGKTTFDAVTHFAGDRLHISDIAFIGAYSGTESDTHGCRAKRAAYIERCTFDNFEGDGLYCNTTFNSGLGTTEGNVNSLRVIDCDFYNNRSGVYLEGDDANAVTMLGCSFVNNRKAGIQDDSFLGNHNFGHHFDGNSRTVNNAGTAAKPASYCYSGGHVYFCIRGQEAYCAANAPTGTTADNTGWGYAWDAGAATPLTGIPAWAGGMTWRAGGPILHDGTNNSATFDGVHIEGNGISQIDQGCRLKGTFYQAVRVTSGTLYRNRASTELSSSEGLVLGGNVAIRGGLLAGDVNVFGYYRGAAADGITNLATRSTQHTINYQLYDSLGSPSGSPWLSVIAGNGFGRTNDFVSGMFDRWKINGSEVFKIDGTGANAVGALTSTSATAGIGYATGAGGAVTQATSRTTGVTLNKVCGSITLVSAAGSTTFQSFTVTNSTVAATDVIRVVQKSGTDKYAIWVTNVAAGSFQITFATLSGTTTEQPVFNFAVVKAVAA